MKKYEAPELEVTIFEVEDVVTTSGDVCVDDGGENQTPPW